MRLDYTALQWICTVVAVGMAGTLVEAEERAQRLAAEAIERIEDAGIVVRPDVVYADVPGVDPQRLSLDLYLPDETDAPASRRPIVLYVHGGGWIAGSKAQSFLQPLALVPQGFVYASANYRLRPDATVAQMAQSVADAAGWLARHADESAATRTPSSSWATRPVHTWSPCSEPTPRSCRTPASTRPRCAAWFRSTLRSTTSRNYSRRVTRPLHQQVFGEEQNPEAVSPWHHVQYGAPHPALPDLLLGRPSRGGDADDSVCGQAQRCWPRRHRGRSHRPQPWRTQQHARYKGRPRHGTDRPVPAPPRSSLGLPRSHTRHHPRPEPAGVQRAAPGTGVLG